MDKLGFVPLSKSGAELLLKFCGQGHETSATLVTSNLPFNEWTEVLASGPFIIRFRVLVTRNGQPVEGANVNLGLAQPLMSKPDTSLYLALKASKSPAGLYEGTTTLTQTGDWEAHQHPVGHRLGDYALAGQRGAEAVD